MKWVGAIFDMSCAKAIYDSLVAEFPGAMQELTLLSRNESGGKDFIKSGVLAFNFDFVKNLKNNSKEKTPDALFLCNEEFYFVEFKEGRSERADVRQKVHEGVLALFQYAVARKLAGRSEFLSLVIKFGLVRRSNVASFAHVLEQSQDVFCLKNMEGLVVASTTVRGRPETIFELLHAASGGAIASIEYVNADGSTLAVCA
jgi:hypothetical protein